MSNSDSQRLYNVNVLRCSNIWAFFIGTEVWVVYSGMTVCGLQQEILVHYQDPYIRMTAIRGMQGETRQVEHQLATLGLKSSARIFVTDRRARHLMPSDSRTNRCRRETKHRVSLWCSTLV